ncbi:hypothetical protein V2J09_003831 [Rumex salicifolius]
MAQQGQYPVNQIHQSYHHQPSQIPAIQPQQTLIPYSHAQFHQYPQLQPLHFPHHQNLLPSYTSAAAQTHILGLIAPPATQSHYEHPRSTAKRQREAPPVSAAAEEAGDAPSPKRKKGQDVLFRIVVPSRQIGKVIGKEGSRIRKIREDTRASIKIADAIARHEERVIIVSSKDNDDGVTNAEKALHKIADHILQDDGTSPVAQNVSDSVRAAFAPRSVGSIDATVGSIHPAHVATNSIRLLIAGSQAGCLIGISGQNIEKLRDSSGAAITVLAPSQLPFCASAHESDRLVQVSGEVPAVLKAVDEIGSQLREHPAKQVLSISPAYNHSSIQTAQQYIDPRAAEVVTIEMVVSETMVGGLIGRCGSNIGKIRNESGAMIKVYGGKGELKHRQIQLAGTSQQVALAKQRIDEYIFSQLTQSGSQPPL